MTKPKTKTDLKSTTAAFEPVVQIEPKPAAPDAVADDEREPEEPRVEPGPAAVDEPALGARAPPSTKWLSLIHTARHLDVSAMSVKRYAHEPAYAHLNFPKPSVVVGSYFWNRDELDAWMKSRVGKVSTRIVKNMKAVAR